MIDASKLGEEYQDGKNKKIRLNPNEITEIIDTFKNKIAKDDFSVAVTYDEIKEKNYSLSAGQYFEAKIEYTELTQEEFENKINSYKKNLEKMFNEGNELQKEIIKQLGMVKL